MSNLLRVFHKNNQECPRVARASMWLYITMRYAPSMSSAQAQARLMPKNTAKAPGTVVTNRMHAKRTVETAPQRCKRRALLRLRNKGSECPLMVSERMAYKGFIQYGINTKAKNWLCVATGIAITLFSQSAIASTGNAVRAALKKYISRSEEGAVEIAQKSPAFSMIV